MYKGVGDFNLAVTLPLYVYLVCICALASHERVVGTLSLSHFFWRFSEMSVFCGV